MMFVCWVCSILPVALLQDTAIDVSAKKIDSIADNLRHWSLDHGIKILVVLVVGIIVIQLVRFAGRGLTQHIRNNVTDSQVARLQRARTLSSILNSVVRITVIAIFIMTVLDQIGVNIGPILAGAGVIGLALGFGAQTLVKDFLSGFFIVLEDQFGIGDTVTIGDANGTVERMTLRMTVLRDSEGKLQYIPNGQINKVTVLARDWSAVIVDVTVAYQTNLDQAIEILNRLTANISEEKADLIIDKPLVAGVQALADNGIVLRTTFKTKPHHTREIASLFRRRVRDEFGRAGLEIPVSQTPLKLTSDTPIPADTTVKD
jgi:small conductance mechanosensitive channel